MTRFYNLVFFTAFFFTLSSCQTSDNDPSVNTAKDTVNYISRVFDYVYAPGQHAASAQIADTVFFKGNPALHSKWIYLGGFGGYIVAGFERKVINREGADFEIFALRGSSPEPAIVYVMQDKNGDGLPNDTWYELKGNQSENTIRDYWLRYYKPQTTTSNVRWIDSLGEKGELVPGFGAEHSAQWWWTHTATDSITLYGSRLPDAYDDESTPGTEHWMVPRDRFTYGYAENIYGEDFDNERNSNLFDISNAIDKQGNRIDIREIHFIKIQTAVFQVAGWTNEVSAEIRGAAAL